MGTASGQAGLRDALAAAAGAGAVREARDADAVGGVRPALVVEPREAEALARALAVCDAEGAAAAPRGGGSKLGWGAPPARLVVVVSLARLSRVVDHAHADMTVTVEAGCTLDALAGALARRGQRLAVDPPLPRQATVGGMLATADAGPLRVRFGTPRDHVLGATVALPSGVLARSGGRVVKNVAGYDLPKLMTGSFGTLGVVVEATLRLYGLPRAVRDMTAPAGPPAALGGLLAALEESSLAPSCVQVRAGAGIETAVDVLLEGVEASLAVESARLEAILGPGAGTPPAGVWRSHERLLTRGGLVCVAGVLPANVPRLVEAVRAAAGAEGIEWEVVCQADGAGLIRFEGGGQALERALARVRGDAALEHGSVVVRAFPPALAGRVDIWGAAPDALPLMRRVKAQFDPRGTLNPGRFVGGI